MRRLRAFRQRRIAPFFLAALTVLAPALLGAGTAVAKVFLTVEEALDIAFPGCEVERRTVFLEDVQFERVLELAGVEVESRLVHPYVAECDGVPAGVAYFDTHRVRTLAETLIVVVDPEDRVRRIEILAFREPEDYIPRDIWYEQFTDQELDDSLDLKREIRGVTGATLTARATTDAVRRVLAFHQVIREAEAIVFTPSEDLEEKEKPANKSR